jgi:hypothetical protein
MDEAAAPKGSPVTAPDAHVLGHLFQIEAEAAALVDDAQAEADRRVAEGERLNRSRYDEQYGREAAELEQGYEKEVVAVKDDYQHQLDRYRKSLDSIAVNQDRFRALMDDFLAKEI